MDVLGFSKVCILVVGLYIWMFLFDWFRKVD